jgi:hypothetical protein
MKNVFLSIMVFFCMSLIAIQFESPLCAQEESQTEMNIGSDEYQETNDSEAPDMGTIEESDDNSEAIDMESLEKENDETGSEVDKNQEDVDMEETNQ